MRLILEAPVLPALPSEVEAVRAFARAKAETQDFRARMEDEDKLFASRVDGILAEFYVSRLFDLPAPDLSVHGGSHAADVGAFQVKACDFDRWRGEKRSFMFYPEALARGEGLILAIAHRGALCDRRHRLVAAFSYADARTIAREPFSRQARRRNAKAVYLDDLRDRGDGILFDEFRQSPFIPAPQRFL